MFLNLTLPIIPNIWFVILLALLTGYVTFLTAKGGLTDNRHNNHWKRLSKRGKKVLSILILIALVLTLQEINTQSKTRLSENTLRKEQLKQDSLITEGINKGVDSSRKKLFEDISKAFLIQELKLDTVKKEIVRIRDSAKNITNNYAQQEEPVILIDTNGIKLLTQYNKERNYLISFKSQDAASTNFNVICYLITPIEGNNFQVEKGDIFPHDLQISKNGLWSIDFTTYTDPVPFELYINLIGTYTNLYNTRTYKVDNVYVFDMKKNRLNTLIGSERQKVLNIVKTNATKDIKFKK